MDAALIALTVALAIFLWLLIRRPAHPVDQLPGPPTVPFFGNALMFIKPPLEGFQNANKVCRKYRPIFRLWLTKFIPVITPLDPKHVETILNSSEHIGKSFDYNHFVPWLGEGLLIKGGSKWHSRRKLLTPAFHFSILDQFIPIFCEKTRILVEKLQTAATNNPDGFDIVPFIIRCALDMICETAMGHSINAQEEGDSIYISSVYEIGDLIYHRNRRPWLRSDWIYKLTSNGRKHEKCLRILHGFTNMVIQQRKEELKNRETSVTNDENDIGKKKRIAFLDLLLTTSEKDPSLTDEEIRAEVDTFMFEGHDTTAMTINWTLYFLSVHQDIQTRCVEELEEIFNGSDRDPSLTDLGNMKYLERVIKESLRLRPPVRYIGRKVHTNIKFDGYDAFPPNTVIHINIYNTHRNPEIYPDPEKFDPDRFLPENCVGRHPYAYIPFSAGPRNCIGQRFAMLEMKEVISTVVRHFRLESCDPEFYGVACPNLILKPMNGLRTRIFPRN